MAPHAVALSVKIPSKDKAFGIKIHQNDKYVFVHHIDIEPEQQKL